MKQEMMGWQWHQLDHMQIVSTSFQVEHVLIVKVSFERRKIAKVFMTHVQVFFRKSLSKATLKENFLVCH